MNFLNQIYSSKMEIKEYEELIIAQLNKVVEQIIDKVEKPLKLTTHFRMKLTTCFGAN